MASSVHEAVLIVLCICARLGHAGDTCPEVKIEGLSGSEKVTVVQTCPGVPGAKGDQGIPGLKGEKGSPGTVGKYGPAGEKGSLGAPGQPGPAGTKGSMGAPGQPGPSGMKGDNGGPGQPGSAGTKGSMGAPGQPGSSAMKGDKGGPGQPGSAGTKGDSGIPGRPGSPGIPGQPASLGERELENINCKSGAKDCKQLLQRGIVHSGWYTIYLKGCQPLRVFCDMDMDGGGWIVFQRRMDGSVDFFRDWNSYKRGFGNQQSEFWLGNDNIHKLTSEGIFELYIYLKDTSNLSTFAKYSSFKILSESEKYKLIFGKFTGGSAAAIRIRTMHTNSGNCDSLTRHNGAFFITKDRDNDDIGGNCALEFKGAWWYTDCHDSNLNGPYLLGKHASYADGINWKSGKGHQYSYRVSEMKLRPVVK